MKTFFKSIISKGEDIASGMVAKWVMRGVMVVIGAVPTWYQTHTSATVQQEKIIKDAGQTEASLTYIIRAVAKQQEEELGGKKHGCN